MTEEQGEYSISPASTEELDILLHVRAVDWGEVVIKKKGGKITRIIKTEETKLD